jgi:hypothetical protein
LSVASGMPRQRPLCVDGSGPAIGLARTMQALTAFATESQRDLAANKLKIIAISSFSWRIFFLSSKRNDLLVAATARFAVARNIAPIGPGRRRPGRSVRGEVEQSRTLEATGEEATDNEP